MFLILKTIFGRYNYDNNRGLHQIKINIEDNQNSQNV